MADRRPNRPNIKAPVDCVGFSGDDVVAGLYQTRKVSAEAEFGSIYEEASRYIARVLVVRLQGECTRICQPLAHCDACILYVRRMKDNHQE